MSFARAFSLSSILALTACGGVEGDFDQEGADIDTTNSAVTSVNNCATGAAPNAIFNFPQGGADQYIRPRNRSNPGGPCGSNPRAATYVEFDRPVGHVVHMAADTTFVGTPNGLCGLNHLIFKVEKRVGSTWTFLRNETIFGYWQGSNCNAMGTFGLYPPDASGHYRIRAVAVRFDNLIEEVRIWADDQMD